MKLAHAIFNRSAAVLVLVVVLLASCAKEEVVAPASPAGTNKSLGTTLQGGENQEGSTGVANGRDTGSDGGWISDDGDDVGDGERNRKKKPNS